MATLEMGTTQGTRLLVLGDVGTRRQGDVAKHYPKSSLVIVKVLRRSQPASLCKADRHC